MCIATFGDSELMCNWLYLPRSVNNKNILIHNARTSEDNTGQQLQKEQETCKEESGN